MKGEIVRSPEISAFAIEAITTNFVNSSSVTEIVRQGWKKPPINTSKVNVDAAYLRMV